MIRPAIHLEGSGGRRRASNLGALPGHPAPSLMSIHVALYHQTHFSYDKPVGHGPHIVRLRPAPHCRTKILSYSQKITGGEHFTNWQQDPFSNWNARLVFPDKMKEFGVEVELVAEMAVHNPFDFFLEDYAQVYPFAYEEGLKKELAPFLEL